ncbi:sulfatase (plasmid) [Pedobacter sp. BS3]|uniref:sulfatase n=1 Tax=Pedobacter sp. BS3 TaxID=2567937 RepID=UPI0011EFE58A|nr:sulfatase [Pedobacter sp. BS3]TZF86158.1 sulfatase [Pedobacter sp. BS3]
MRNQIFTFTWICFMLLGTESFCQTAIHQRSKDFQSKPNVVFFLVDDLGWTDVEPFGTTFYETPNIKKLAAESVRFTRAYAACPVCSPTRASIMTGKYPARLQTTDWFGAPQPEEVLANPKKAGLRKLLPASYIEYLPLQENTIAEAFKQGGYTTFIAGKWHLGDEEKYWPQHQGFDVNKGGFTAGHPKSYFSPYFNPMLPDGPVGEHLPDRLANETIKFINENKDKPFFAYFSFYSVHTPLQGRKDLIEKYERKKEKLGLKDVFASEGKSKVRTVQANVVYAAMVEAMDESIGKVIQKLKDDGLYDNTIIVFFSDNGGLSTAEGHPTSNLPLRGGKGWLYEGGIREPLLIRWPGHTTNGAICNMPVISTDFYPTLLQMTGQPLQPQQHVDGESITPLLAGKSMKQRPLYWHYPHYGNQGGAPGSAVIDGDWKLIRWYEDNREELYNLRDDISEKNDLIQIQSAVARKLRNELDKWLESQHAVMPKPNPAYKAEK